MTRAQFVKELRSYLKQVLSGVCRDPDAIQFAVDTQDRGIFVMAKVGPEDFAPIKYEGVLEATKQLVTRFGSLRVNDQDGGKPFAAFFQLYNPAFEANFTPEKKGGSPG
jgi:hypothetical protein